MRQLLVSCSSTGPVPLHEGKSALWHLAPVLRWLITEKTYEVSADLVEISEATMKVNAAVDALRTDEDTQNEIRALFA